MSLNGMTDTPSMHSSEMESLQDWSTQVFRLELCKMSEAEIFYLRCTTSHGREDGKCFTILDKPLSCGANDHPSLTLHILTWEESVHRKM